MLLLVPVLWFLKTSPLRLQTGVQLSKQLSKFLSPRARSISGVICRSGSHVIAESSVFGNLIRIRIPGDDVEESFLGRMEVPTFAAIRENGYNLKEECLVCITEENSCSNLEPTLGQGPAFILTNALPREFCEDIIQVGEMLGFRDVNSGKNNHGALQIVAPEGLCSFLAEAIRPHINFDHLLDRQREMDETDDANSKGRRINRSSLVFAGLNRRWRLYRYSPNKQETFAPHIDCGFPPSSLSKDGSELVWDNSNGTTFSRLTVLFYLNDDFVGGATNFYQPGEYPQPSATDGRLLLSVQPKQGSCLVFPQAVGDSALEYARQHWPLHEGSPVTSGTRPKYVVRSDLLFR